MKAVTITNKARLGMDEVYGVFYICPKCKSDDLMEHHKFCSSCGIKLDWKINKKQYG